MRNVLIYFALAAVIPACSSSPAAVSAIHVINPAADPTLVADDFFALPFPNDLRRHADGTVDISTFPHGLNAQVDKYLAAIDNHVTGFGTQSSIYFRFTAPIDPATLPATPEDSVVMTTATAFVVDVTPTSPTYGKLTPVIAHFSAVREDYIRSNWLALEPAHGFPLRQVTTYAAILTDGIHDVAGASVGHADELTKALSSSTPAAYEPLRAWLKTQPSLASHIINATVFTTMDATTIMQRLRASVYKNAAEPVATDVEFQMAASVKPAYNIYYGKYLSPNFQQGEVPYSQSGGDIIDGDDGLPAISRTENLRFALTVPKGDPPTAAGWPIVIYAHGTGGSYTSFINDGSAADCVDVKDASGASISKMAMISIDQVLHGPRDPTGSNPDYTFFNYQNVDAAVNNPKQGAADDFQLLRLVKALNQVDPTTNQTLKFDPDRIYFKGHSQGGLTGPLFLAYEPEVKAAILSGAGGNLLQALLNKTEPPPAIIVAVSLFIDAPIDEWHPVLNMLQMYLEPSDPSNYGPLFFKEPPLGLTPKSIFQTLGIVDHYTPIPTIKVFAKAMGVQPINPQLEPIDNLALAGLDWGNPPTQLNVANGQATGVLLEYMQDPKSDGHFVVFDIEAAALQANRFLATHAKTGISTCEAP